MAAANKASSEAVSGSAPGMSFLWALAARRPGLLLIPVLGFMLLCFGYPVLLMVARSFTDMPEGSGGVLSNYIWLFSEPTNITILIRTFLTAGLVVVVCLLIGYPYAYLLTVAPGKWRAVLLVMVLVPFWTSFMVRNYAWLILLQKQGVVNNTLVLLGFERVDIIGNLSGVTIGMAHIMLPFLILPLYASMLKIDRRLLVAAQSLGATPMTAFFKVYFPLSLPGVLAGSLIVYVMALGFYITPALLGSPQNSLISQLIATQAGTLLAWGRAGAMATVLLLITLAMISLALRANSASTAQGKG